MKANYNRKQFTMRNELLKDYGFTSYQEFLNSEFWRAMKDSLKTKKSFQFCYGCGNGGKLEFHHWKYKNFLDGANSKNLITMCRECHEQVHKISRERNISFKSSAKKLRRANGFDLSIKQKEIGRDTKFLIITSSSLLCPKCKNPMQRRQHVNPPTDKTYYFNQWDYCKPCGHVQHYDEYKIILK